MIHYHFPSRPEALSEKEIGDYSVKTFINNIINPASNKLAETTTEFYPKRVVTGGQAQGGNSTDFFFLSYGLKTA